ncbi:NAD(P)/FAD-dependent oxidoreductase [Hymenobacter sp. B81]|uniref:NAD(P)/FAD-dependent oxidoreductase n=1 Tax=Hymenobacter sp. B81 TaxID=3344878 RepID=UPI0037DC29E7
MQDTLETTYDAVIVGGSYAGLGAALMLARALRRVLVVDGGRPCNRQTPHSHGFLTRDGETPARMTELAREQLLAYPTVALWYDTVERAEPTAAGFALTTRTGQRVQARRLLLATGVMDELPPLPGFAECWGISVLHCPYCHGYEVHGQPLGVLANGDAGFEFGRLLHQWSPDLRLLTNGPATFTAGQAAALAARGIGVEEQPLTALRHQQGQLQAVVLADGRELPLTALFARVPFRQHSDLAAQLGCAHTEAGYIQVDELGLTTVPGVYAAGDATTMMRQLTAAAASGSKAGAAINRSLVEEDFALA